MRRFAAARRGARILTAATIAASAAPLLAEHWWVLELFTHFRLQLIGIGLVLAVVLLALRSWSWSLAVLVIIGINVHVTRDYLLRDGARAPLAERDLRVMSANVEAPNTQADGLIAQIEREGPDVVAIIEYTAEWALRLARLGDAYPHRVEVAQTDRFGIALLSRWPLIEQRVVDLRGTPAVDAQIDTPQGLVRVIAVHAVPPLSSRASRLRNAQLEQLALMAARSPQPLVVLGDLNLSPYSPHFTALLARGGLRDARAGHGPTITWPTFFPLLGIPIDHCLLGPDWDSIAYRRQPAYGSDHYAIAVDLTRKTTR